MEKVPLMAGIKLTSGKNSHITMEKNMFFLLEKSSINGLFFNRNVELAEGNVIN